MKIVSLRFIFLFFISSFCVSIVNASTTTVLVGSGGDFFSPANFTICQGDTIYFVWSSGTHNVHITTPATAPSPDLTSAADTFTFITASPGSYIYQCDYHAPGMAGAFTVVSLPLVNLGPDITYCGDMLLLNAVNPDASYLWSTGASTSSINVSASNTYYVEVTNSCGTVSDTIVVVINPIPFISAGNAITICSGVTATLTATGGVSYVWLTGFQTTTSIVVSPANSTFYSVIGTSANGCTKLATVNVAVTYPGSFVMVSGPASCPVNNDGSLQVLTTGGSAPFTYLWNTSPVQTSALATGLISGSYSVIVSDTYGCISTLSDTVSGTAANLMTTFSASNKLDGNMFDITALNNIEIAGFDGNLDDGASAGAGGYIKVYYKPGTHVGFESISSAWTLIDSAFVNPTATGIPTSIPISANLIIPAGQTYAFYITGNNSGCDVVYSNGTAVGAVYALDTNLQIKVGVGKGYPFASTFSPRVWNGIVHYCANAVVGINQDNIPVSESKITVYPNPFISKTTVVVSGMNSSSEFNFILVDIFGKTVKSYIIRSSIFELERIGLPSGIYFFKASDVSGILGTGKLIIE